MKKETALINVSITFQKDRSGKGHISYFDLSGIEVKVEFSSLPEAKEISWEMALPGSNRKITQHENDHLYRLIGEEERKRNSTETDLESQSRWEITSPHGIIIPGFEHKIS